jgi:toxin ParE1/3/4
MVEVIWAEPALADLDAIADYIALENPRAASKLVQRILERVEQLADFPESGSRPQELGRSRYRQIIEPPCRIFYRYDRQKLVILHVMRSERLLRSDVLTSRAEGGRDNLHNQ